MKSLALTIAVSLLATGAAFAAEIKVDKIEVKPESRTGKATGTTITGKATAGQSGVRSEAKGVGQPQGTDVISAAFAHASAAAKEIGGSCQTEASSALTATQRAQKAVAVNMGLAGDLCASHLDKATAKTDLDIDVAMVNALRKIDPNVKNLGELKAKLANDPKTLEADEAAIVVAGGQALATDLSTKENKVPVLEGVQRLEGTVSNECDIVSKDLGQANVLQAAEAKASSIQ